MSEAIPNNKVLVVDDNTFIHEAFDKVLLSSSPPGDEGLDDFLQDVLKPSQSAASAPAVPSSEPARYEIVHAYQGEEAVQRAGDAARAGKPFALAFVDMRMPPGIDGLETIKRLWREDPNLEVVICTAYSDYTWDQIIGELGQTDQLMIVRKPFDMVAVRQMTLSLVKKWNLKKAAVSELDGRTAVMEHVFDNIQAALFLMDAENRVVRANKMACSDFPGAGAVGGAGATGLTLQDVVGYGSEAVQGGRGIEDVLGKLAPGGQVEEFYWNLKGGRFSSDHQFRVELSRLGREGQYTLALLYDVTGKHALA